MRGPTLGATWGRERMSVGRVSAPAVAFELLAELPAARGEQKPGVTETDDRF